MPDLETNASSTYSPSILEHFIGQDHVIRQVKVALDAAWNDGERFPNSLMTGPPGLGKTALALILAKEMGCEVQETLAQSLKTAADLAGFLLAGKNKGVLFIDEADELPTEQQTLLYRSIEEGKLFVPWGKNGEKLPMPLEKFTLLMATNHEFKLVQPLRERFKLILRFETYDSDDLTHILVQHAKGWKWEADAAVYSQVASRSRGVPRRGIKLMEACRRVARSESADVITEAHFEHAVEIEQVDPLGLDHLERRYLYVLQEANAPLQLSVIAMRVGNLPTKTVSSVIEPFLFHEGLVTKEGSLRVLTSKGKAHLVANPLQAMTKGSQS